MYLAESNLLNSFKLIKAWNFPGALTCVSLNSGCNLASPNCIEESNVLTKNSLKVFFPHASRVDFSSVGPYVHIYICADKDTDA